MKFRPVSLACLLVVVAAGAGWIYSAGGGRVSAAPSRTGQVTVATVAALNSALQRAQGGATILLAPGTYSGAQFSGIRVPGGVTIRSANPARPAVLSSFRVSDASGLRFSDLELWAQGSPGAFAFVIRGCSDIHFDHVRVHGSLDGDVTNDPSGLQFLKSSNVSITNSEFQQLERGAAVGSGDNVVVSDNYVHDIRSDGFDFAEVSDVKIEGNVLKDFSPIRGDHPDAIQFWTQGTTTASRDILISGNLIMRGDGAGSMQGIFMGDEVGTLPFERVTISDNLILRTGYNAIRVHGAKDLTVTNNELVSDPGSENQTFMLVQKADGVSARGNKAISIGFDRVTNLSQQDNQTTKPVQDKGGKAFEAWKANHPRTAQRVRPQGADPGPPPAPR